MAVMELCLKSKFKLRSERDDLISTSDIFFGFDEPLAKILNNFGGLVLSALMNIKFEKWFSFINFLNVIEIPKLFIEWIWF